MKTRRQRAAWASVAPLGVLLAFAPAVLGLRTLSHRDTDLIYGPVRTLVVEALRAGRLPLWNPYEGTGKPLFAEGIHAVLHPVSLLGAFLAPSSIDFLLLAYLAAAALGAHLLARTLGGSPPAAAGAGLAFALSGYSVSMTGNLVFLAGLATLPWLLAAARSAGRGDRWGAVLTALAAACAFLSGDTQVALVGILLGLFLAHDAGGRRGAARALAGLAAGTLLAGVQIAATRELLPLTSRGREMDPVERTAWSLAPARLLEWVVPGFFRGPLDAYPEAASGVPLAHVFADSVFLGAPLVAAAGLGIAGFRRRTQLLLALAAAVLLWLALGPLLGARQLLEGIPVWRSFRYAEKLMAPLALVLSALAALGVDGFAARRLPRVAIRAMVVAAIAAGAAWLFLLLSDSSASILSRLAGEAGPLRRSTLTSGLPHLVVALAALVAVDRLRSERSRGAAFALLLPLAAAAALPFGSHLGDLSARRAASPLQLEGAAPAPRIVHPADKLYGVREDADHVEAVARAATLFLYPAANVARRVDTVEPYGAFKSLRLWALGDALDASWSRAFRRYAVTHAVLPLPWHDDARRDAAQRAIEGGRLLQRDRRRGFELWAVPHRPWAFFAGRAVAAEGTEEAWQQISGLLRSGDDATVVVEAPSAPPTAPGRVLAFARGTESVRVEAESPGPALLVVQDAYWPGWRAAVDGQPAEILAADYLVRAVRWPPGRHVLEMTYDPPELRAGLALSALGAALVFLLVGVALRSSPRTTAPPEG